ncbi:MAG: hypothetical protein FD163_1888 [Hyphomonadaceae bacterium]|nr:MAG: hypothetical protein FD128_1474 [Hyphomonadaceae bacterium]KAF0184314.1 MAG: hypothetical protein FD163_1888 [Hyphomonadaceae bacterium]
MNMKQRKLLVICATVLGLCAFSALAQVATTQFDPDKALLVEDPPPKNDAPQAVDEAVVQPAAPADELTPAPDLPLDEALASEVPSEIKTTKRRTLQDVGTPDYIETWTEPEEQHQAIIAQTVHRRREIDPAKLSNLTELSRVFGALHALRVSCVGQQDQTFRSKMATMLDMEAPSANYIRDPLIIAFNSGFASGGRGEQTCPRDNEAREANLARVGRNISLAMVKFYSPPILPAAVAAPPVAVNQPASKTK